MCSGGSALLLIAVRLINKYLIKSSNSSLVKWFPFSLMISIFLIGAETFMLANLLYDSLEPNAEKIFTFKENLFNTVSFIIKNLEEKIENKKNEASNLKEIEKHTLISNLFENNTDKDKETLINDFKSLANLANLIINLDKLNEIK